MVFEPKSTNIYKAVKFYGISKPGHLKMMGWLFFVIAILLFLLFLKPDMVSLSEEKILGLFIISIILAIKSVILLAFFEALSSNFLLKKSLSDELSIPGRIDKINLAEYLDFNLALAVNNALKFCNSKNIPVISLTIVFYLWKSKRAELVFEKLDLGKDIIKKILKEGVDELRGKNLGSVYSPEFLKIIKRAAFLASTNFHRQIELRDFLVAVAEESQLFNEVLDKNDLDRKDVDHVTAWEDFIEHDFKKRKQFWRLDNLRKKRGIGKRWAAGYTVNLDRYSVEVTNIIKRQALSIHLMSHEKEIYAMERILARSGANNVLLVGRPGVGRSTIAYAFAKKITEGRSFSNLNDKRVLELDMQAVLAGLDAEGEILERLKIIFAEAVHAGNVILILDDIHNFLGSDKGPGDINIASVIQPYLSSTAFQVIGITNYEGWHKYIENEPGVKNMFVKVEVAEPDIAQTILILEDMLPGIEKRYGVFVSYRVLRDVVDLADHYIQNVPFPEKAVDILTEAAVYTRRMGERKILTEYVNKILSERTEIPIGEIQEEEREKLLNLESIIHKRIIDQEEAVEIISEAMRRARAGVRIRSRPIGAFLFLGPTGVGKTETSKALAEAYFGSEKKMIRFDMSEYQDADSINRLIGLAEQGEPGLLTKAISDDPFSLVLLDEIEKANKNILNLFLQVFDEGWLTDSFGRKVSFRDSILIGTSNAGAEFIRQQIKEGKELKSFSKDLTDYLLKQAIFRPEFLNRFDAVVVFKPLAHEHLIEIAKLMLNGLSKRLNEGMGIRLVVNPDLVEKIAKLGYQPEFGARPMRRVIQNEVESRIAKRVLEQGLKRGDFVEIKAEEIG